MEHNRYIGPAAKFKEFFVFSSQKSSASQVKLDLCPVYDEVSGSAIENTLAIGPDAVQAITQNCPRRDALARHAFSLATGQGSFHHPFCQDGERHLNEHTMQNAFGVANWMDCRRLGKMEPLIG
jgi:hypothetical protein